MTSLTGPDLLQDCVFINNTSVDNFGGAVQADSSLISISDSLFSSNQCASVGGVGGGLASELVSLPDACALRPHTNAWGLSTGAQSPACEHFIAFS